MKLAGLLLLVIAALGVGWLIGWRTSASDARVVSKEVAWRSPLPEGSRESPLGFEPYYFKVKQSVEVKFEGKVALIDGEIFEGENLDAAILRKKDKEKARFLVLVSEDLERFGPAVERLSRFRTLGFEAVVLMRSKK